MAGRQTFQTWKSLSIIWFHNLQCYFFSLCCFPSSLLCLPCRRRLFWSLLFTTVPQNSWNELFLCLLLLLQFSHDTLFINTTERRWTKVTTGWAENERAEALDFWAGAAVAAHNNSVGKVGYDFKKMKRFLPLKFWVFALLTRLENVKLWRKKSPATLWLWQSENFTNKQTWKNWKSSPHSK